MPLKIFDALRVIAAAPRPLRDAIMASRDAFLMAATGNFQLDITVLDERLSKIDPEYDPDECTYNGKNVSMSEYVELKYGKLGVGILQKLL